MNRRHNSHMLMRARLQTRLRLNRGAILLDLFIATLIFVTCAMAIGNYGLQSLQLAQQTNLERLALAKAESIMARVAAAKADLRNQTYEESFSKAAFEIRVTQKDSDVPSLKQVTVRVTSKTRFRGAPAAVELSRLIYRSDELKNE